jgi:hypothetical protein
MTRGCPTHAAAEAASRPQAQPLGCVVIHMEAHSLASRPPADPHPPGRAAASASNLDIATPGIGIAANCHRTLAYTSTVTNPAPTRRDRQGLTHKPRCGGGRHGRPQRVRVAYRRRRTLSVFTALLRPCPAQDDIFGRQEIEESAHRREQTSTRRENRMDDPRPRSPSRQHIDQRPICKVFSDHHGRHLDDAAAA